MKKEYSNGETTIVWQPDRCIHSGVCLMGLPKVFSLKRKPWIQPENASTEELEELVFRCPTQALTIKGKEHQNYKGENSEGTEVRLMKMGPAIIYGAVDIKDSRNRLKESRRTVSLCRCTRSKNHPYCDGSHAEKAED